MKTKKTTSKVLVFADSNSLKTYDQLLSKLQNRYNKYMCDEIAIEAENVRYHTQKYRMIFLYLFLLFCSQSVFSDCMCESYVVTLLFLFSLHFLIISLFITT